MTNTSVGYTCPNCGGPLEFSPGTAKVTCPYCDTEFEVAKIEELFAKQEKMAAEAQAAKEAKWDTANAGSEWSEDEAARLQTFTCSSCGAELVSDGNTMATECCYCGNPTMLPSRFSGMLKPDFVIPFTKTKEDAVSALNAFYKGKRLLPKAFTADNRVEAIQPMYVPFWLFDSAVTASAEFKAETDTVYETKDERITETSVYRCDRKGTMRFQRIPVDGSQKMDDTYMESIEPYDYDGMMAFSSVYLTGCLADKYDVDAEAAVPRADERVRQSAIGVLEDTVEGYDRVELKEDVISKDEGAVSYAMAPVWILTTRYQNQPYTFMMNGQTGKMIGSLPYDKQKANLYWAGSSLILTVVFYFIAKLFV